MTSLPEQLVGSYALPLLTLAVFVCLFASVTGIGLLRRAVPTNCRVRVGWLTAAAFTFGGGIWATQLILMLAYRPANPFDYAVPLLALALVRGMIASLAAFALAMMGRPRGWRVALGGVALGGAIAAVHFTIVAALRPLPAIDVSVMAMLVSLAIGCVCGVAAVAAVRWQRRLAAAAFALLAGIGVPLTAMAGTHIGLPSAAGPAESWLAGVAPLLLSNATAAVAIGIVAMLVLTFALLGALVDGRFAQRAVQEAARMRRFADATFEGLLFISNGLVVDANRSICTLLGQDRSALLGRPLESLLWLPRIPVPPPGRCAEAELIDTHGRRCPVEVLSRPLNTNGTESVLAVRDISDRKQAEARIRHLAHHDGLTGLPNRTLFQDRLAKAISMAERADQSLALLSLDLDGFKAVNELLGHPVGDQVLVEVANRLSASLSDTDTVARLGSDEFAVVQSFCEQPQDAAALADRLVRKLAESFEIDGHQIGIGASVGIALYPFDGTEAETLLRQAGLALHRAKQDGRGLSRFFEPRMDERQQSRRQMEQDLRQALPRGELRLHYQPLLDGATLQVEGFEALLRWQHPERGLVPPGLFIPVAEECGLIGPFGTWVLEAACAEAAGWPLPWRVAVNLSPVQFRQRDLAGTVEEILARTGLAPSRLELEITENILIDDADRTLATLRRLKSLGVRIALDDFGTGYSSLSYLRRFPFDTLKIDASFVQALGDGGEADAIVRAIVALGRSLSLRITAEGVETDDQLRLVRAQACDQVQGVLLGRPMPAAEIAGMRIPAFAATAA